MSVRRHYQSPRGSNGQGNTARHRVFTRATVSLVIGIVIGAAIPAGALGIGATHIGCSQGKNVGLSGAVSVPIAVAIPPPGGSVNWTYSYTTYLGDHNYTLAGVSTVPDNYSAFASVIYNWTAVAETTTTLLGRGPNAACPAVALESPPPNLGGGCSGCSAAPSTPAGVGQRSAIPTGLPPASGGSVYLNASYPSAPSAAFSWSSSGGGATTLSNVHNFSAFMPPSVTGPFYVGDRFVGLGLSVRLNEIQFGVPVQMTSGAMVVLPSELPSAIPRASLSILITYVFPAEDDQGTWNMYPAGANSPYSLGGYVFEQTSTTFEEPAGA